MRRVNLRDFQVPEYDGEIEPVRVPGYLLTLMRAEERQADENAMLEQGLSRRLAHTYKRNVFCSLGIPAPFIFDLGNGRVGISAQMPPARLIRTGPYVQLKVSRPAATALLQRDERRSSVSQAPDRGETG